MRARQPWLAAAAAAVVAATVPAAGAVARKVPASAVYLVGGAARSINPSAQMLAAHDFFLGGYGFGSGRVGNVVAAPGLDSLGNRYATGILGDGVHTRAFAVSDRSHTIVLDQIEAQGYFDAYKQGPFGLNEIRKDAATAISKLAGPGTAPAPAASEILVDSDHSHGGPDTVGVWGGVPTAYLKFVHDRTVAAIVAAWRSLRPATLSYGAVHAGVDGEAAYQPTDHNDWLLTNQFAYDPANQVMDDELRVLQARDARTHKVFATYVNFSAHPTVLGSSNRLVTGDYVGRLNRMIAATYGGFAMDQVGTLGRTQPADRGCPTSDAPDSDPAKALCALDTYAARVLVKVKEAVAAAAPVSGPAVVAMSSYLMTDTTTSPVLTGILYGGQAIGAPAARAANSPWYTGSEIGTSYFVGRIGSVLLTGGPGEMYPQIVAKVRATVPGMQGYLNVGTAGDFLGYIIAPLEAYTEPVKRSFVDGSNSPDPIGNDNYFFNASHTLGERLTCGLLRGAGEVLGKSPSTYWSAYDRCTAFVNDFVVPAGADTQFPEQPDLSAVLTHL